MLPMTVGGIYILVYIVRFYVGCDHLLYQYWSMQIQVLSLNILGATLIIGVRISACKLNEYIKYCGIMAF